MFAHHDNCPRLACRSATCLKCLTGFCSWLMPGLQHAPVGSMSMQQQEKQTTGAGLVFADCSGQATG